MLRTVSGFRLLIEVRSKPTGLRVGQLRHTPIQLHKELPHLFTLGAARQLQIANGAKLNPTSCEGQESHIAKPCLQGEDTMGENDRKSRVAIFAFS